MFTNRNDAIREALRLVTIERCSVGQHVLGCPHRPSNSWVARANTGTLPASDRTGFIRK